MPTTFQELADWMNAPRENEKLEFKEAVAQIDNTKLFRHCVAMANEGGGKLILGVTDAPPRRIVGTFAACDPEGMQEKILDKLHKDVRVEQLDHPDGRVIIFHVPSRAPADPWHLDGAYWMRSGSRVVPMPPEKLRQIFDEGKPDWLMRSAQGGLTASEVITLLDTQPYFDLQKKPYPTSQAAVLQRFESEKLIIEDRNGYTITNLGAVLFAKHLHRFEGLSRKAPRVVVFDGSDKLKPSRVSVFGNKGYALGFAALIDYINDKIPSNEVIGKAFREELKMFPGIAIRELVANALIHQDFNETGTSVTVEIYNDRIEVSNPGRSIISPDRFADEYQSRNERLADLMRRLKMCEEQGLGIDRVIASAEIEGLPAPDFRVGERHTLAVMFARKRFEEMNRQERVRSCFWHCVLQYVTNKQMTNSSLRERFNVSVDKTEAVSAVIYDTVQDGRIKSDDPSRTSRKYAKYIPYWA